MYFTLISLGHICMMSFLQNSGDKKMENEEQIIPKTIKELAELNNRSYEFVRYVIRKFKISPIDKKGRLSFYDKDIVEIYLLQIRKKHKVDDLDKMSREITDLKSDVLTIKNQILEIQRVVKHYILTKETH